MPSPAPKEAVTDASHLYEVERRARHCERPGFRITELTLSPAQTVPWHTHTHVSDTPDVLDGAMRLFVQSPAAPIELAPGEIYQVMPGRPHMVTNAGAGSMTFLVLSTVGE